MTHYAELMFLHLVGSAGDVVHSGASRARNVNTLFSMLGSVWCRSHKKCIGTHPTDLMFLNLVGAMDHVVHSSVSRHETSTHYLSCSGGHGTVYSKSASGHITLNLCFGIRWDMRVR
jgi:hypothetical protein